MNLKSISKNPWFISLTTGIILIITGYLINPIRIYLANKVQFLFTQRVEIQLWLLIILLTLLFLLIVLFLISIKAFHRKPAYYNYRKDKYFDLYWKWHYKKDRKGYLIEGLGVYCPEHDIELAENYPAGRYDCPYEACDFFADFEAVEHYYPRVKKIIEKKIVFNENV